MPTPKDDIFVDEDNASGQKTLEGLKIPANSAAKRQGNNLDVASSVIVAI